MPKNTIIPETQQISLLGKTMPYLLKRGNRQTIQLSIAPNHHMVVHAPYTASLKDIEQFLKKREYWIKKTLQKLPPPPPPKQYHCGEEHLYLGKSYPLKINQGQTATIQLRQECFEVILPNIQDTEAIPQGSALRCAQLLEKWYKEQAQIIFAQQLQQCLEQHQHILQLSPMTINLKIKKMRSRWGSCSTRGNISLNLHLIKTPLHCIEYVIVHELCHLKEMNHSAKFWDLVSQCLPHWRQAKTQLDLISLD